MRKSIIASVAAAGLLLVGCANNGQPGEFGANKTTAGGLVGAGLGGLAGSQIGGGTGKLVATGAGVLIGALLGSEVGKSLDKADRDYATRAQNQAAAAPIGQTIVWSNPETGHFGHVTPTREGRDTGTGAYCREFQQTITVGGQSQQGYGTACRQPDGSWKVVQ